MSKQAIKQFVVRVIAALLRCLPYGIRTELVSHGLRDTRQEDVLSLVTDAIARFPIVAVVTRGENGSHAYRTGLRQPVRMRGSSNPHATLTEEKVIAIKRMLLQNVSQTEIAAMMGVTKTTICSIHKKKSWKHIEA